MNARFRIFLMVIPVLLVALAACGGEGEEPDATPSPTSVEQSSASTPSAELPPNTDRSTATPSDEAAQSSGIDSAPDPLSTDDPQPDDTLANRPTPDSRTDSVSSSTWDSAEGFPIPTSTLDEDGDNLYTTAELKEAIYEVYPFYTWPTAYHPTADEIVEVLDLYGIGENDGHEAPGEHAWIGNAHQCAWEMNWLDGYLANDQEQMDLSMEQLYSVTLNNPFNVRIVENLSNIYGQAHLGDPAPMQQRVNNSCNFPFLTGSN